MAATELDFLDNNVGIMSADARWIGAAYRPTLRALEVFAHR
jgi:hypothetical protein